MEIKMVIAAELIIATIRGNLKEPRFENKLWEQIRDLNLMYFLQPRYSTGIPVNCKTIAHTTPTRVYIQSSLYQSLLHMRGRCGFFDYVRDSDFTMGAAIKAWREIVQMIEPEGTAQEDTKNAILDVFG